MTKSQFDELMGRIDRLERLIEANTNPSKHVSRAEQVSIFQKAMATGDKQKIKETKKQLGW